MFMKRFREDLIDRVSVFMFFVFVFFLLLMGPAVRVWALDAAPGRQYDGIDVSQWQGNIDFGQVAASGIRVVYIRSSLGGGFIDPYFEQNYQRARAAGLKVGFYHYVTARTASQARYQAQFFVRVVQGKVFDCRLAMDFEDLTNLSAAEADEIGLAFIREVERVSGKGAVVYSNTYNAGAMFSGALTRYPLWAAEYGVSQPASSVNWSSWAGWQYTDQGRVPGISGYVDRDIFTDAMFLDDAGQVRPPKEPLPSSGIVEYQVGAGDTLWAIARRYRTSVAAIAAENGLVNPDLIYPGQTLCIKIRDDAPQADSHTYYTVRAGDTLTGIAARFQTTVARLVSVNGIKNPDLIYTGERLQIPTAGASDGAPDGAVYTVRPGDTLWEIGQRYGVSVSDLAEANDITDPGLIYPGEVLRIP